MKHQAWIDKCNHWKSIWPVMQPEWEATDEADVLNLYAVLNAVNNTVDPKIF